MFLCFPLKIQGCMCMSTTWLTLYSLWNGVTRGSFTNTACPDDVNVALRKFELFGKLMKPEFSKEILSGIHVTPNTYITSIVCIRLPEKLLHLIPWYSVAKHFLALKILWCGTMVEQRWKYWWCSLTRCTGKEALVPCLEHGLFFSNIQLVW